MADRSVRDMVHLVKGRLRRYHLKETDIEMQTERLERLEAKMYSVSSPMLSDMPKAPTPSHDQIARLVAQKEELTRIINQMVTEQEEERKRIEDVLCQIPSPEERAVIRMRYLDGEKWEMVSFLIFGADPEYVGREESYIRRTTRLHGQALAHMAKLSDGDA